MGGKYASIFLAGLIGLSGEGCISYKKPTSSYVKVYKDGKDELRLGALEHSLYRAVPFNKEQIKWYDLPHWASWALAGNEEDGIFGEQQSGFYSTNINYGTFCKWNLRNPMHNFMFHVVGSAGADKHRSYTLFDFNFKERGKSRAFTTNAPALWGKGDEKWQGLALRLNDNKPIIVFRLGEKWGFEFYLGWRKNGVLGAAARGVGE